MKTLIEINRNIWAEVKHFATINNYSVSNAVEFLLSHALDVFGFSQDLRK
jgi:hypothetical protein